MAGQNPQNQNPQATQADPYAAFGGSASGTPATPTPQAAPQSASPTGPDPYSAFGGSIAKAPEAAGAGGSGSDVDDSIWGGFSDKIGKAASGLWELTKAQSGHVYDTMEKPVQDVSEGHYKQGVIDSLKATILPDTESPLHHVIRGMVMDSFHNIKDAGAQELEGYKQDVQRFKGQFTGMSDRDKQALETQSLGNKSGARLSLLKAVAPGLEQSGEEMANPATRKHGIGGLLGEGAMVVAPEGAGKVGGAVVKAAGRGLEKFGMGEIGGLIHSTNPRDFWYGADPRKAILDEKISPRMSLEGVRDQLEAAQGQLENDVRQKLSTSKTQDMDVVPLVKQVTDDSLKELSQTRGFTSEQRTDLVNAVKDYRDNLLSAGFDSQTGKSLGNATKTRLGPDEVADFRRDVGKSTRWNRMDADPAITSWMNNYQKEIYAKLNDMIEAVEPGTKTQNKRIQNAIGAIRLIDKKIPREEFTNVGLARAGRKIEVGAGLEMMGSGHPVAGTALIANRALRSTPGRVAAGRGAVAAGKVLQGGAPASTVGTAAMIPPTLARKALSAEGGAAGSQTGQAAENQGIENWVPIETSDGQKLRIHPEDLEEAKKRDPKLKVLNDESDGNE